MRRRASPDRLILEDARSTRLGGFTASVRLEDRRITVPRAVRIRGDALEWSDEEPGMNHARRTPAELKRTGSSLHLRSTMDDGALWNFMRLHTAPETDLVAFAQRYGVLYLSARGMPNGEPPVAEYPEETVIDSKLIRNLSGGVRIDHAGYRRPVKWRREPLPLWRDWALIVRLLALYGLELREALRRIDPQLLLGRWHLSVPPYADDEHRWVWSEPRFLVSSLAWVRTGRGANDYRPTTLEEQRSQLGGWLDMLAACAGLTLRVTWENGALPKPGLDLPLGEGGWWVSEPNGAWADVVAQLIAMLLGDTNTHICPDCGELYPCQRRRGYCPACRARRRQATRNRTWREHPDYNARRRKGGMTA